MWPWNEARVDHTLYRTAQLVTRLLNPQISASANASLIPSLHTTVLSMAARLNLSGGLGMTMDMLQVYMLVCINYVGHMDRQTHLSSLDLFLSESFQRLKQSNWDCTQLEKKQHKSGRVVSLVPRRFLPLVLIAYIIKIRTRGENIAWKQSECRCSLVPGPFPDFNLHGWDKIWFGNETTYTSIIVRSSEE